MQATLHQEQLLDLEELLGRKVATGDCIILAKCEYVGPNPKGKPSYWKAIPNNGKGFPSNGNPASYEWEGWRGTTNDWAVHAEGLFRVSRARYGWSPTFGDSCCLTVRKAEVE